MSLLLLSCTPAPLSVLATCSRSVFVVSVRTVPYPTEAVYWRESGLPSAASWVWLALAVKPCCWFCSLTL
ncbi:hypothetical protein D3C85_1756080 [compost metagenome]